MLSELLEINPHSLGEAITDTCQLVDEHRHTLPPTTVRLATVARPGAVSGHPPITHHATIPARLAL